MPCLYATKLSYTQFDIRNNIYPQKKHTIYSIGKTKVYLCSSFNEQYNDGRKQNNYRIATSAGSICQSSRTPCKGLHPGTLIKTTLLLQWRFIRRTTNSQEHFIATLKRVKKRRSYTRRNRSA